MPSDMGDVRAAIQEFIYILLFMIQFSDSWFYLGTMRAESNDFIFAQ